MSILVENLGWMVYNIFLALVAVVCALYALRVRSKVLKILLLFLWFLFVPNTIYIITDVLHIPKQWAISGSVEKIILLIEYAVLLTFGIAAFLISIDLFRRLIFLRFKKTADLLIFFMNFAIAFGVVLGRIQRANSWDVFFNAEKIVRDTFQVLSSFQLLMLVLFFGALGNILYFLLEKRTRQIVSKYFFK